MAESQDSDMAERLDDLEQEHRELEEKYEELEKERDEMQEQFEKIGGREHLDDCISNINEYKDKATMLDDLVDAHGDVDEINRKLAPQMAPLETMGGHNLTDLNKRLRIKLDATTERQEKQIAELHAVKFQSDKMLAGANKALENEVARLSQLLAEKDATAPQEPTAELQDAAASQESSQDVAASRRFFPDPVKQLVDKNTLTHITGWTEFEGVKYFSPTYNMVRADTTGSLLFANEMCGVYLGQMVYNGDDECEDPHIVYWDFAQAHENHKVKAGDKYRASNNYPPELPMEDAAGSQESSQDAAGSQESSQDAAGSQESVPTSEEMLSPAARMSKQQNEKFMEVCD
jgi:hypothetical protein